MLVVPVALQPVLGGVFLDEVVDTVPEVIGLQEQQLDDEVADLGFVVLMAAHRLQERARQSEQDMWGPFLWEFFGLHAVRTSDSSTTQSKDPIDSGGPVPPHQTQDESVQRDDVVLPDHVVENFDALVELRSAGGYRELVHQEVCESSHVSHQCTCPDALQHPNRTAGGGAGGDDIKACVYSSCSPAGLISRSRYI